MISDLVDDDSDTGRSYDGPQITIDALYYKRLQYLPIKFRRDFKIPGIETHVASILNKSAFLWGVPGSGKTTLAAEILKAQWRKGQPGKFIIIPELVLSLQSDFENSYSRAMDISKQKGLLVLDDLGAEKTTDYVRQMLYVIINAREMNEWQTIITSNLSIEEISTAIDPRIASRIAGMGEVINLGDKDFRLIGAGQCANQSSREKSQRQ